jgi:hypothetical protein
MHFSLVRLCLISHVAVSRLVAALSAVGMVARAQLPPELLWEQMDRRLWSLSSKDAVMIVQCYCHWMGLIRLLNGAQFWVLHQCQKQREMKMSLERAGKIQRTRSSVTAGRASLKLVRRGCVPHGFLSREGTGGQRTRHYSSQDLTIRLPCSWALLGQGSIS